EAQGALVRAAGMAAGAGERMGRLSGKALDAREDARVPRRAGGGPGRPRMPGGANGSRQRARCTPRGVTSESAVEREICALLDEGLAKAFAQESLPSPR